MSFLIVCLSTILILASLNSRVFPERGVPTIGEIGSLGGPLGKMFKTGRAKLSKSQFGSFANSVGLNLEDNFSKATQELQRRIEQLKTIYPLENGLVKGLKSSLGGSLISRLYDGGWVVDSSKFERAEPFENKGSWFAKREKAI